MIVAFSFFDGDAHLALDHSKLIAELEPLANPHKPRTCLLVCPAGTIDKEAVAGNLSAAFAVQVLEVRHGSSGHPLAPNRTFADTALHCSENYDEPFYFMEADSCPTTPNWLQDIEHEYERSKPFLGHKHENAFIDGKQKVWKHMTGSGVYPKAVMANRKGASYPVIRCLKERYRIYAAQGVTPKPWDIEIANEIWPNSTDSRTIRSMWKCHGYVWDGDRITFQREAGAEAVTRLINPFDHVEASVVHAVKEWSLAHAVRRKVGIIQDPVIVLPLAPPPEPKPSPFAGPFVKRVGPPPFEKSRYTAPKSKKGTGKIIPPDIDWSLTTQELMRKYGVGNLVVMHWRKRNAKNQKENP